MNSGLTSIRLKIDITNFPPSMTNYLFLLQNFMNQLGTNKYNYEEFSQTVNSFTSGINIENKTY